MPPEHILILVTVGNRSEATSIAQYLVKQQLAACVGILNQSSIYRWKGEIVTDEEVLLVIKTVRERFKIIQKTVLSKHSYELPEIIGIDITEGYSEYLAWITQSISNLETK